MTARLIPLVVGLVMLCVAAPTHAQTTTRYVYDAAGRLVLVVQQDGTVVSYDYDAAGNLIRVDTQTPANTDGDVTGIHPSAMIPASESVVTIFGVGLAATNAVIFDAPGIDVSIQGTPTPTALSLSVRVGATVAPGDYGFTVHRTSLPSIASGGVVLRVRAVPTLVAVTPAQVLTGQTIALFTLTGARLDRVPNVVFSRPGLTLSNIAALPDGTSLTGRLQVSLSMAAGPVGVTITTLEGTSGTVMMRVDRSVPGLTGSYYANTFVLDAAGLPVVPATSPTFIRSDAALQFGTSTSFRFRPCFIGSANCLNSSYTVRWQGQIFLDEAGIYTFALNSSDASQLRINGTPVVSNPGTHVPSTAQGTFDAPAAGSYPLIVTFNSNGATPGIDLLYRPPGTPSLVPVPAANLWSDGSVYDPLLTSAADAVSVSNPAPTPSPGGTSPAASVSSVVSFMNPAPTPQPGGAAPVTAVAATVGFANPAAVPQPGGMAPVTSVGAAVGFTNPAPVPQPGGTAPVGNADAAVGYFSPAEVTQPGGSAPAGTAGTAVGFSNPAATISPGGSEPLGAATGAVGFASGPVVYHIGPTRLSRSDGGGAVTLSGRDLHGATSAAVEPALSGLTATLASVAVDGRTAVVTVTISSTTPTGFVNIVIVTPNGISQPAQLEIVP